MVQGPGGNPRVFLRAIARKKTYRIQFTVNRILNSDWLLLVAGDAESWIHVAELNMGTAVSASGKDD